MESYLLILNNDKLDSLDPYFCFLTYERKQKIRGYRSDIDKKVSIYGELIIRAVLSKKESVLPQDILLELDAYGKPFMKNDCNIHFNISHTKYAVFCVISNLGEVGADIEIIGQYLPEVMDYIGHPEEIEIMKSVPREKRAPVFYEIWTRKEAYGKKNGLGICQDLKRINTLVSEHGKQFISWKEEQYMCSICTNQKEINHKYILTEEDVRESLSSYL